MGDPAPLPGSRDGRTLRKTRFAECASSSRPSRSTAATSRWSAAATWPSSKLRLALDTPARVLWFAPEGGLGRRQRPAGAPEPLDRLPDGGRPARRARWSSSPCPTRTPGRARSPRRAALRAPWSMSSTSPTLSDFHTPALIDRGEVVVGIATGGAAPVLARDVRSRVEAVLPKGLEILGAAVARHPRHGEGDPRRLRRPPRLLDARAARPGRRARGRGRRGGCAPRDAARAQHARPRPRARSGSSAPGPGDPELLTLKALRAHPGGGRHRPRPPGAPTRCSTTPAATRAASTSASAAATTPSRRTKSTRSWSREAREGRRVVRLKGGDPFVFGRGGEELAALREAGVDGLCRARDHRRRSAARLPPASR